MRKCRGNKFWALMASLPLAFSSPVAYALDTSIEASNEVTVSEPTPLLDSSISFDIFSASFFKAEENLLTLGDTYKSFKQLGFPGTLEGKEGNSYFLQFVGIKLSFTNSLTYANCAFDGSELNDDAVLESILLDSNYSHRVILVLPTTGSILDLKLKGDGAIPLDAERLATYLKKAKALFEKEFNETGTKVIKSELSPVRSSMQSYDLLFKTLQGTQRVLLAADFDRGTLSIKLDLLSSN